MDKLLQVFVLTDIVDTFVVKKNRVLKEDVTILIFLVHKATYKLKGTS